MPAATKDHRVTSPRQRRQLALAQQIASLAFFRGLQPGHARQLAECARRVVFQPGETIFQAGDPANRFYILETGNVVIETPNPGAAPIPIQALGPGDVLGWSWLYPPFEWNLNARATEQSEAIFFYGTRLRHELETDLALGNELYQRIAQVMLGRLRHMRTQLVVTHRQVAETGPVAGSFFS